MTTQSSSADDRAALADLVPVPTEREMPASRRQAIREHLISEYRASRAGVVTSNPQTRRERRPQALRRPTVAVISALAVTAAVTGIVILANGTATSPRSVATGGCVQPASGNDPFPGGHQTTITGAQSAVRFHIAVPHTALADQRTLSQVWVSSVSRLVALEYRHRKITILMMPWRVTQSPGKWFRYERRIMIKKYVRVGHVNGTPALVVIKPDIDACRANPALVEFFRRGLDITVRSWSYGPAALIKIADSIH